MSNFYGDSNRWFVGVVEDNSDPMKLGRVRVRVFGLHSELQEDIQTADLPWAQVLTPGNLPGISGKSETIQLQPGARVFGVFLDGDAAQLPLVLGSLPHIENASALQRENFRSDDLARQTSPQSTTQGTGVTGERNKIRPKSGAALGAKGSVNAEKAYNYFLSYGFTPEQAAGIVGNLMQESGPGLSTTIKSAGTEQSYGIAQWNSAKAAGNRLGLLKEFAKDSGKRWTDLDIQLQFITYELENYSYLGLSELRSSMTVEEAVIAFETKYERPSVAHRDNRIAYAYDVLDRYGA